MTTPKGSCGPEGSFSGFGSAKSNTEFGTKSRSRDREPVASANSSSKRGSQSKSTLRDDGNSNKENNPSNSNANASTEKRIRDPSGKEQVGLPPKHH